MLDTNVLISACLKPDGLEALVVAMALDGRIVVCVTEEVWAEYMDVLFRRKFRACRTRAELLLRALAGRVVRVTAAGPIAIATDEDDNRFLECAAAAEAQYLVTGNLRHYPAEWGGMQVVNARRFTELTNVLWSK